jgi:hypothetical protein
MPTALPTIAPTTATPTLDPTAVPTTATPTRTPTLPPGETYAPSAEPTLLPTAQPTEAPTFFMQLVCPDSVLGQLSLTHKADGGSRVSWKTVTARTVAGADVTAQVTCSHTNGAKFPAGTTTVRCSTPDGNACSFPVTLPIAEYHFFDEALGQHAPLATDRAGNMDLFAGGGASIATESSKGLPALLLDNKPIFPPRAAALMDTAQSQPAQSARALTEWTMVVYALPNYDATLNFGLGQLSGGAGQCARSAERRAPSAERLLTEVYRRGTRRPVLYRLCQRHGRGRRHRGRRDAQQLLLGRFVPVHVRERARTAIAAGSADVLALGAQVWRQEQ